MKSNLVITCIILVLLSAADAVYGQLIENIPWCKSLAYPGSGYWSVRVPVRLDNHSQKVLRGEPCCITVSEDDGTAALIGNPVAGLRVADDKGVEFLFELENSDHQRKRNGTLVSGDIVIFPVNADTDSTALVFLYSGNPSAWLPPDIRDFTDDIERSERAVNEWLKLKGNVLSDKDGLITHVEPVVRCFSSFRSMEPTAL